MVRRNFDLPQARHEHVNAEYLKGLINVVPMRGAGDKPGWFCIGRFAIEMYCNLLEERQLLYPPLCWMSLFFMVNDQVRSTDVR